MTTTFQHHVDPSYYNFIFKEPMYLTVEYISDCAKVSVLNITAPPYLISAVVLRGCWQILMKEVDEAAKQNAQKMDYLDPVMKQALQPFLKY